MGVEISCDYCGESIVQVVDGKKCAGSCDHERLELDGKRHLYYHSAADEGESCYERVVRCLSDMATWAHGGDGSGLEWRLMPAPRRTEDDGHTPVMEEWRERIDAGTALYKFDLCVKATDGLRKANLVTLEEVAARSGEEIRAISGVGPKSFRRLREELEQRGLSFREEAMR